MALSQRLRKLLSIALARPALGQELADALDADTAGVAAMTGGTAIAAVAASVAPAAATGTNTAGTAAVMSGGVSTGTGKGGDIIRKTAFAGSTGTTANALVERERIISARKTIADTGTSLLDIALAAGAMAALTIEYGIRCSDGTDMQAIAGTVNVAAVNKAGSYTFTATDSDACLAASGASTLTLAWAKVDGTNKITLKLTPTSSLTPTTYDITLKITNHTGTVITPL